MDKKFANYLLSKTKDDYNLIGHDFSSKRWSISPDLLDIKKFASAGDKILDLGCGNGRFSEVLDGLNVEYIGADISETLIKIATEKYPDKKFQTIDFLNLPFPDNSFDKVYCLAVFHHIPSNEYRLKFLKEINRILKKDGILVLTVWNLLIKKEIIYQILKNAIKKIFQLSKLDFKDILLPFKRSKDNNLTDRYLHCFTLKEIKSLLLKTNFQILQTGYQNRGKKVVNQNIYSIARKK